MLNFSAVTLRVEGGLADFKGIKNHSISPLLKKIMVTTTGFRDKPKFIIFQGVC